MSGNAADRLKRGALILGDLWKKNIRCAEEFGVLCSEADPLRAVDCFCEPKTPFCKAKMQWLGIAADIGREIFSGEIGLIETMSGAEWDASGLTVKFEFQDVGVHGVGPKGVMGRDDLLKLAESQDTLASVFRLMKTFPGIKVQEVLGKPEETAPAASDSEFWRGY